MAGTVAANSGLFLIADATRTTPFTLAVGSGTYPDAISTATSEHAGFAQNLGDQGFSTSGPAPTTPFNGIVETLTLPIGSSTPVGTYRFVTTSQGTSLNKYSSVGDNGGKNYPVDNAATFTIKVVPEPGAWSILAVGGTGLLGMFAMRRRLS